MQFITLLHGLLVKRSANTTREYHFQPYCYWWEWSGGIYFVLLLYFRYLSKHRRHNFGNTPVFITYIRNLDTNIVSVKRICKSCLFHGECFLIYLFYLFFMRSTVDRGSPTWIHYIYLSANKVVGRQCFQSWLSIIMFTLHSPALPLFQTWDIGPPPWPSPSHKYCHLVATEARTVGKQAVHILLECFLVH